MVAARKTPAPAGSKSPGRTAAAPAAKASKPREAATAAKTAPAPRTTKIPASTKSAAKSADTRVEKPRKPKLVRDSFTIPKAEYTVLEDLKVRAGRLGRPTKKSELLRAGLIALAAMQDEEFVASVGKVPALKTGRPARE